MHWLVTPDQFYELVGDLFLARKKQIASVQSTYYLFRLVLLIFSVVIPPKMYIIRISKQVSVNHLFLKLLRVPLRIAVL